MPGLMLHSGGQEVSRQDLKKAFVPECTSTWFPVSHDRVVDMVEESLDQKGFKITKARYALAREGGARMFATFDLNSPLADGVTLSVGVRNSVDKSFPLGFVAGNRVFVCDNLAFSGELLVKRKHTKFGLDRYEEAIALASGRLGIFRAVEAKRIGIMQETLLNARIAESIILRAFEQDYVSTRNLGEVVKEWREPRFEAFKEATAWGLLNAFTTVLGDQATTNPQKYADVTMGLQSLICKEAGIAIEPITQNAV